MLEIETFKFPDVESSIHQEVETLKSLYFKVAEDVRTAMIEKLKITLTTWIPEQDAVSIYPFLRNLPLLIEDYASCVELILTNNMISLVVNRSKLAQKGLPGNLSEILEYGNQYIPAFPHLRPAIASMNQIITTQLEGAMR